MANQRSYLREKESQGTHLNIQQWRKNLNKNKNNYAQDAIVRSKVEKKMKS